jgi:hypothetical protein
MDGVFLLMRWVKRPMNGKSDWLFYNRLTFINLLIYKLLMNVNMNDSRFSKPL